MYYGIEGLTSGATFVKMTDGGYPTPVTNNPLDLTTATLLRDQSDLMKRPYSGVFLSLGKAKEKCIDLQPAPNNCTGFVWNEGAKYADFYSSVNKDTKTGEG